ncbi:MAG: hypothetical protein ABW044_01045 [Cellvibrio sp.]
MSLALYIAAALAIMIGSLHSFLGERYILIRLFRRDNLPKLFGGTEFTTRTLRFVWHITTVAWWGFAAILIHLANATASPQNIAFVIGITFMLTGLITLVISRVKHLAWIVFVAIGGIALYVACN